MHRTALFLILLLLVPLAGLAAQEVPPLAPGARVRVTSSKKVTDGIFVALNADSLILKAKGPGVPLAIPLASVSRLDVSRSRVSRRERAREGAGIGFLSGAALGFITTAGAEDTDVVAFCGITGFLGALNGSMVAGLAGGEKRGEVRVLKGAGVGFLSGAAVGGILSSAFGTRAEETFFFSGISGLFGGLNGSIVAGLAGRERWESVALPVRVGVAPQRGGGVRLAASFAF